jgi:2',3'-cyclic-nucleotide 2'-phosphodiesterase (5'-nucleotidase family)
MRSSCQCARKERQPAGEEEPMIGDTQFPTYNPNVSPPESLGTPQLMGQMEELSQPVTLDTFQAQAMAPQDLVAENKASASSKPKAPKHKKNESAKAKKEDQDSSSGDKIKVTILHTNDLHGASNRIPALEKMVQELKKANPDAVLVDSGDAGNTANHSDPSRFQKVVDFMNKSGYLAVVPGNHEFQWGKDVAVDEYFGKLDAKVVSANILDKKTGKPLPHTVPHFIADINGVKVGFVGITTDKMATPQHPDMGSDVTALPEAETLVKEVQVLRKEGAEVIVALAHLGVTEIKEEGKKLTEEEEHQQNLAAIQEMAAKVPDVDVIAAGHDHKITGVAFDTGPYPHKTYIVEAGSHGNNVGKIDLYINPETRKVSMAKMKNYPTEKYVIDGAKSPDKASEPPPEKAL